MTQDELQIPGEGGAAEISGTVIEPPVGDGTRERIMAAAMELVSRKGLRATTVRDIAQAACVNLAAVNYHYRSKRELLDEALMRVIMPVNQRRIRMLASKARDADGRISLPDILDCLFRPVVESPRSANGLRMYLRALQHFRNEASEAASAQMRDLFDEAGIVFIDELCRTVTHLSRAEIIWRYELARGGLLHVLTVCEPSYLRKRRLDAGQPLMSPDRYEEVMAQLIASSLPSFAQPAVWGAELLRG